MLTCYLDESGIDNDSPTAVMGGLFLTYSGFFWLQVDWKRTAEAHRIARSQSTCGSSLRMGALPLSMLKGAVLRLPTWPGSSTITKQPASAPFSPLRHTGVSLSAFLT